MTVRKSYYKNIIIFIMLQLSLLSAILLSRPVLLEGTIGLRNWLMIEAGVLFIFVCCILERFAGWQRSIAGYVVFVFLIWKKFKELSIGLSGVVYKYVQRLNFYYHKSFELGVESDKYCEMAYAFVLLLITFTIGVLYVRCAKTYLFMILPVSVMVLRMMVGFAPPMGGMMCLLLLLLFSIMEVDKLQGKMWRRAMAATLLLAVVSFTLANLLGSILIKNNNGIKKIQYNIEQTVKNIGYSIDFADGMVDNHTPRYRNKEVFKITSSMPVKGNLYLKSFTAREYKNSNWKSDAGAFEKACKMAGYDKDEISANLAKSVFDYLGMDSSYTATDYEVDYTVSFLNKVYMPYGTLLPVDDVSVSGDSILTKGVFNRSVVASGVNQNSDANSSEMWNDSIDLEDASRMEEWQRWYSSYAQEYSKIEADSTLDYIARQIKYYSPMANSYWANDEVESTNFARAIIAHEIAEYFARYYKYSLELDSVDGDAIDYFLEKSHRGYCVHFATAGVLLLRNAGVPARYASGYVVKQSDFAKDETGNYVASVKDSRAHAWVEVYFEGVGWLPMEMTPGYGTVASVTRDNSGSSTNEGDNTYAGNDESLNDTYFEETESVNGMNNETESQSDENTKNDMTKDATKDDDVGVANKASGYGTVRNHVLLIAFTIVTVLIVLFIIIIFKIRNKQRSHHNRKIIIRTKTKLLKKHKLLCKKQRHKFKNDTELLQYLIESYKDIDSQEWSEYMCIVKKARFSNEDMTAEEFKKCADIYTKIGMR